jgi:hypothetical protein
MKVPTSEEMAATRRLLNLSRESDGATAKDFIRAVPAKKTAYALKFLKRFGVPDGI